MSHWPADKRPTPGTWVWFETLGYAHAMGGPWARLGPHKVLSDTQPPPAFNVEIYSVAGTVLETRWIDEERVRPESSIERSDRITAATEPWRSRRDANLRGVFGPQPRVREGDKNGA